MKREEWIEIMEMKAKGLEEDIERQATEYQDEIERQATEYQSEIDDLERQLQNVKQLLQEAHTRNAALTAQQTGTANIIADFQDAIARQAEVMQSMKSDLLVQTRDNTLCFNGLRLIANGDVTNATSYAGAVLSKLSQ